MNIAHLQTRVKYLQGMDISHLVEVEPRGLILG